MASAAQIAANRRNARRSTGPKSVAGKARVALNGLRHGLCSARVLLPGEDDAEFAALLADLTARWRPADEAELALLRDYAAATWRLDRIPALEAALLRRPAELDPAEWDLGRAFLARGRALLRLSAHEVRISGRRARARRALQALQAARRAARPHGPESERSPRLAPELALDSQIAAPRRPGEGQRAARSGSPSPGRGPDPRSSGLPQAREDEQDQWLTPELALDSQFAAGARGRLDWLCFRERPQNVRAGS